MWHKDRFNLVFKAWSTHAPSFFLCFVQWSTWSRNNDVGNIATDKTQRASDREVCHHFQNFFKSFLLFSLTRTNTEKSTILAKVSKQVKNKNLLKVPIFFFLVHYAVWIFANKVSQSDRGGGKVMAFYTKKDQIYFLDLIRAFYTVPQLFCKSGLFVCCDILSSGSLKS